MGIDDRVGIEDEARKGDYRRLKALTKPERVEFIEEIESWNTHRALAMAKIIIGGFKD